MVGTNDEEENDSSDLSFVEYSIDSVNNSFSALQCSSLKKIRSERAVNYGKREITESSGKLAKNVSEALGKPSLANEEFSSDCSDCELLMYELKEKLHL